MAFLKSLLGAAKTATATAAPIVAGAFGGPAAAAGVKYVESKLGAQPGRASSIVEARSQDRQRMNRQYGI
jgi:hypothetical protein